MRALKICVSVISTSLAACDGTAENQVPISAAANYSIAENGTLSGQLHATDSDNDKITYAIANPPANGSVTMDGATGAFTYIPNQYFYGSDTFLFTASDGQAISQQRAIQINVAHVNKPPVSAAASYSVAENSTLSGRLPATDRDNDNITYVVANPPANGSLTMDAATGAFTYIPNQYFYGSDTFLFAASDGQLTSQQSAIQIDVAHVNQPPISAAASYSVAENGTLSGQLHATDRDNDNITYVVARPPARGSLTMDAATGAFTYVPNQYFYGSDTFLFAASDGQAISQQSAIQIDVAHVNQPPHITPIGNVNNSPDVYELTVMVDPQDHDGDVSSFTAQISDPGIASYRTEYDPSARRGKLLIRPLAAGQATVRVQVSDGVYSDSAQFQLTIASVVRRVTVGPGIPPAAPQSVQLTNDINIPIDFTLDVNDRLFPGTIHDILNRAGSQDDEIPSEPLARKVWRLTQPLQRRGQTLTDKAWQHDPVILYNSLGIGFCDDYASAYWDLMNAAGQRARVWTLNGHVVPEVFAAGRWQMYDPDLGVYYINEQGQIAGVEELETAPQLITNPLQIVQRPERVQDSAPYSAEVAGIYTSTADNTVWDYYMQLAPARNFSFSLPPGGAIAFGGRWAPPPLDLYGVPIGDAVNLELTLPAGWSGTVTLPLVLVGINGSGQVGLSDIGATVTDYGIGSPQLQARLDNHNSFVEQVSLEHSTTPTKLIYLINTAIVRPDRIYSLVMTGVNVAGLTVGQVPLPPENTPALPY